MLPPAPSSRVVEISASLGPGVSPGPTVALGDGQLRYAQRAARESVAEETSPVRVPLCSDQFKLAKHGGALVSGIDGASDSARQLRERTGFTTGDLRISASLEPKTKAVRLDGHRRADHREDRPGAGQDGADQVRIHPAPNEKEAGIICKVI